MAIPDAECRKLLMNESVHLTKHYSGQFPDEANSMNPITMPELGTPEAQEKRFSSDSDLNEIFEKTPETAMKSPSSVLNPPSSLKRKTIRDYFLAPM